MRRVPRVLALAVVITVVGVVVATAAADPGSSGAPTSPQASSPPGSPTTSQVGSQIVWRNGQSPVVTSFTGGAPTLPSAPASPNNYSACNVVTLQPDKVNSSTVSVDSTVSCTTDVDYLYIAQELWRGLGPTYEIGANYNSDNSYHIDITTFGACAHSTWAYFGYVPEVEACSTVNGCVTWGPNPPNGPYKYITC
jgi:hypothetical protein